MVVRTEKFIKQIGILVVFISVVLGLILRLQGMDLAAIFFFVVALAVSIIPEGLPVALTVALSIAVSRMAKRKVTYMLISTGAAEVTLILAAILFGLPLPLLAVQILWLNLVTNGIQDIAMAFEAGEPGAMKRKPRKPNEKIFNPQMISQTLVSGLTIGLYYV